MPTSTRPPTAVSTTVSTALSTAFRPAAPTTAARHARPAPAWAAATLLAAAAHAQPAAGGASAAAAAPGDAVAACERAARQALATQTRGPAEFAFTAGPTVQPSLSSESQTVLQGAGRWRGAEGWRSFSFSCNVDLRSPEAVGLVLRDTTPGRSDAPPERALAEADLSHLSLVDCESRAVATVKRSWPRATMISFEGTSRTFRQTGPDRAELLGHGRALPAPGASAAYFGFACELDPRDGRVLAMRVSGLPRP